MKSIGFSLLAALAASAAVAAAGPPTKTVRDGIAAWQRSDYATAVAIWRPLAEKGDADAAFNLGQAYRLGRGVSIDLGQAKTWLEKAARAGHLDAQTTLGLLLFDSGDRASAMLWLKKAAQRAEPRAMLVYGTALFNGDGVPKDPLMAYAYVSRAAAQGLEPAKATLQQMDGVLPVDLRRRAVEIALHNAADKPAPGAKQAASAKPAATPVKAAPAIPQTAVPTPPRVAGATGRWRIQLGAFSRRSAAEALYGDLRGSAPIAGHQPVYEPVGSVTRLQIGGFPSRAAAQAACTQLSGKGHACFPVAGK
jgi:tetratricopeptide (TPR) repeat protein